MGILHKGLGQRTGAFIQEYEPIVRCLPIKRFTLSTCATDFSVSASEIVPLKAELTSREQRARINLLCALCLFATHLSVLTVFNQLKDLTTFEASVRNAVTGMSNFNLHLCRDLYFTFCEARTELRKSVFKEEKDSLAIRLIKEDPYSKSLFGDKVIESVQEEACKFRGKAFKWESILTMKRRFNAPKQPQPQPGPSKSKKGGKPRYHHDSSSSSSYKPGPSYQPRQDFQDRRRDQGEKFRYQGGGNKNPSKNQRGRGRN